MLNLILYGLLGVALSAAGVGLFDKPWQFFVILALVVGIDLSSRYHI